MKNQDRLWEISKQQQGIFTAEQAKSAGYRDSNFAKYIQSGAWERIQRGIYCLTKFPTYNRPELVVWTLWSLNTREPGMGVWTHETALEIFDLSDVNPTQMHMTVPFGFRRTKKPDFIHLHFGTLSKLEIQKIDGYYVTTPIRTLVDIFREESFDPSLLHQCVNEAISKGLITKIELARAKQHYPEIEKILEMIDE
ncbi:MAG: hypothetical protein K940chlam2_00679 [Chlamydiae bacterium]|nr:hypothetical protein [Chlamydiota bacterium]